MGDRPISQKHDSEQNLKGVSVIGMYVKITETCMEHYVHYTLCIVLLYIRM